MNLGGGGGDDDFLDRLAKKISKPSESEDATDEPTEFSTELAPAKSVSVVSADTTEAVAIDGWFMIGAHCIRSDHGKIINYPSSYYHPNETYSLHQILTPWKNITYHLSITSVTPSRGGREGRGEAASETERRNTKDFLRRVCLLTSLTQIT